MRALIRWPNKRSQRLALKIAEKHGAAKLVSYAALTGLVFVEDYLALAKSDASMIQGSEELKTIVAQLAGDWRKTNTAYVRSLSLTTDTDLDLVGKNLRESFQGASIYPNLVDGFYSLTRNSFLSRDPARALRTSRLAFELYPESLGANLAYGLGLIVTRRHGRRSGEIAQGKFAQPQRSCQCRWPEQHRVSNG